MLTALVFLGGMVVGVCLGILILSLCVIAGEGGQE